MRSVIALCSAALVLSAAPAVADSDSLAQRADAAAAAARLSAKVSSAQANATIAFLVPLRVSNPRIGRFGPTSSMPLPANASTPAWPTPCGRHPT